MYANSSKTGYCSYVSYQKLRRGASSSLPCLHIGVWARVYLFHLHNPGSHRNLSWCVLCVGCQEVRVVASVQAYRINSWSNYSSSHDRLMSMGFAAGRGRTGFSGIGVVLGSKPFRGYGSLGGTGRSTVVSPLLSRFHNHAWFFCVQHFRFTLQRYLTFFNSCFTSSSPCSCSLLLLLNLA